MEVNEMIYFKFGTNYFMIGFILLVVLFPPSVTANSNTTGGLQNPAQVANISKIVPSSVVFECKIPTKTISTLMLYKNDVKIVTAYIFRGNLTIKDDSDEFSVFGGGDFTVLSFELERTSLDSEGFYKCITMENNIEVIGNKYSLTVYAAPVTKTNTSSVIMFSGETRYVGCTAIGKPQPKIQWVTPKGSGITSSNEILEIRNANVESTGSFQCLAINKYGRNSKNVSVVVNDQHPGKPALLQDSRNESSLTLKWLKPSYLGRGSAIKKFNLKCSLIGFERDFSNKTLMYSVGGLNSSTKYEFSLRVCNFFVCGEFESKTFETAEQGKPTKPTELKATKIEGRSMLIAWTHGQHSRSILYTNISYWKTSNKKRTVKNKKLTNNDNKFNITGLSPYTDYTVEVVTCIQGSLKVLCSDAASLTEKTKMTVPSAPKILSLQNTNADEIQIVVLWREPLSFNGPDVTYKVHYKETRHTRWISNDVPKQKKGRVYRSTIDPIRYVIANMRPITSYDVKVSAGNSAGRNDSKIVEIKTDEAAPHKPHNLTLKSVTADTLTVTWSAPKHRPSPIEQYIIEYRSVVQMKDIKSLMSPSTKREVTIPKLSENTTYKVAVKGMVKRTRDERSLFGESASAIFRTTIEEETTAAPETKKGNNSLIWATVLSLLVVVIVIFSALLYCKKKNVFDTSYGRTRFYVEELEPRTLASRMSARSVERKKQPIDVEDFPEYVVQLHADSDYLFSEEYLYLGPSKPDFTWEHSTLHLNRAKNRYQDIVAYDHSRVRLMSISGIPASNYINANFIDGFDKKPAYIATQAPLNQTIEDFWRMVWEQDARIIVMLTNLWERGKRKCDQYWPHQGEIIYGNVTVRTVEERKYACYVHRVFSISWNNKEEAEALGFNMEEPKLVRQFHFTDWPDFGVPRERSTMLSFVHVVRRYMQETDSPAVVHCSAGVGRSGTFIVIEAQIERINRKKSVNIYEYIKNIRSQRNFLVQQEVQYIFLHDALVDYIKCGLTAIPVLELDETLEDNYFTPQPDNGLSVIDEEWQIINEFSIQEFEMLTGKRPCNQQKNRDSYILPNDASRVRLAVKGATDGTDYINANYIDGFHKKKKFIVTQMPLYDTIEDFWRMVWENFSEIIISLLTDNECEKEDYSDYLPRADCNPINFGAFEIRRISETVQDNVRIRELELVGRVEWDTNVAKPAALLGAGDSGWQGESEKRKIYHYQFLNWSEEELPMADQLFKMIDNIKERKQSMDLLRSAPDNSPLVVHCSCGVGRSGVFCAINNIKEQMDDYEETVDVFTTVRLMRSQRPLIIQSKLHYEYLYQSALRYKEISPKYSSEVGSVKLDLITRKSPSDNSEEFENLIENMEHDDANSESSA